jgi:Polysaccharide lyase
VVRVVEDPLRKQGLVYRETVTAAAHASVAKDSDSVYLWNARGSYLGNDGQQNWIHFRIMFPTTYRPTPGEWNIFAEFHDDPDYQSWYESGRISKEYPELALYVTNYTGRRPALMWRVRGGTDGLQDMSVGTDVFDVKPPGRRAFRRNHWYDMLLHVLWSPDPERGRFAWWLDGRRQYAGTLPTLWRRPDGSTDHVEFELNNYRQHADWSATVYYSKTAVGPTRGSVAFHRP